jgi:hypothetical protein
LAFLDAAQTNLQGADKGTNLPLIAIIGIEAQFFYPFTTLFLRQSDPYTVTHDREIAYLQPAYIGCLLGLVIQTGCYTLHEEVPMDGRIGRIQVPLPVRTIREAIEKKEGTEKFASNGIAQ